MGIGVCSNCGEYGPTNVHHKDEDRSNGMPSNLVTLCVSCHRREHLGPLMVDRGGYQNKRDSEPPDEDYIRQQYIDYFPRA